MNVGQGKSRLVSKAAMRGALTPLVILIWLGLGSAAPVRSGAAAVEPVAASSGGTYTADLNCQETDESLVASQLDIKLQSAAFPKEPSLGRRDVLRGEFLWGRMSNQSTPFIWDKGHSRLYLDLNRNRDLTDDPTGIFASSLTNNDQTFTNIHLSLPTAAGNRPVRVRLDLYSRRASEMSGYAWLCCYWQAKLSLRGTDWQFGLAERLVERKAALEPFYLLLRPWAERQRPLRLGSGSPDFFDFTNHLFFGGQAYELDCRYAPAAAPARYRITLTEQAPRLGELDVTGTDLHRLILTARRGPTVLLDQPQGKVKVPVGTYSLDEIWLRQGEVEVLRTRAGKVTVDERHPAKLVAGGPLTNSVTVTSQGHNIQINYALLGADGGAYRLARPDYKHPPEFAIFHGTNRLATGKFQYG